MLPYRESVFFYGTLQTDGSLYDLIYPAVILCEPARLTHHGIYKSPYGLYPEAYPLKDHEVKGTLFELDITTSNWREVMLMELRSGYKLQYEQVLTNHGLFINALTFIAKHEPKGFLIESGDFSAYCRSLV